MSLVLQICYAVAPPPPPPPKKNNNNNKIKIKINKILATPVYRVMMGRVYNAKKFGSVFKAKKSRVRVKGQISVEYAEFGWCQNYITQI